MPQADDQWVLTLALQLRFKFHVTVSCDGLVGASPEGPCDNVGGLDLALRHLIRDAANFLYRPSDQRWDCI